MQLSSEAHVLNLEAHVLHECGTLLVPLVGTYLPQISHFSETCRLGVLKK